MDDGTDKGARHGTNPPPDQAERAADPRPDIAGDSSAWLTILAYADAIDPDLYGRLHYLRCGGARIEETVTGYRLSPGLEDWLTPRSWAKQKAEILDPVRQGLIDFFAQVKAAVAAQLPPGALGELWVACPFNKEAPAAPPAPRQEAIQGWLEMIPKPDRHPR
jgi:hypothetical protein